MEIKEHVPWITAMLTTAVAFVATRYWAKVLTDARLNGMATTLVAIAFVNKVAPLE